MPKNRTRSIALTGGGTAGHVMPHLALLPLFEKNLWRVFYVGTDGIEKDLLRETRLPFFTISAGKLRRYKSLKNFTDIFRIMWGFFQALYFLGRERPDLLFSKGGFVSVPVAVAAWCLRIPVVSHESDLTPGLANRIISRFATKILFTFPETERYLQGHPHQWTGTPVRPDLFTGQREEGLRLCGFSESDARPILLVMGGSQGAQRLNESLAASLAEICKSFRVIHITGKGKHIDVVHPDYKAFEYVGAELKHIFAATDIVCCRAGANSIFEMLALRKPMVLIPLEIGSRGDQVDNAKSFVKAGWATLLRETELTSERLIACLTKTWTERQTMAMAQAQSSQNLAAQNVFQVLEEVAAQ